jgi:hypothetical protein
MIQYPDSCRAQLLVNIVRYIYKKRDCIIAVPLIEALALPSHQNSNTVAHAVCIGTPYGRTNLHTLSILVSHCFG